jgi:molecular chaperone HscB
MRHEVLQQARNMLRLPEALSRAPYICASCRIAAVRRHRALSPFTARALATSASREIESQPASKEHSQDTPQIHHDFFPETFPSGPPPKTPFSPDLKKLRKEFLQLQGKAHPDLAPEGQKRHAEALSARINEAYKALQDPLKHAQYLLSLHGIDVEDESAKLSGGELLMEVMEAREAVEEAADEEELAQLKEANDARIAESVRILNEAFAREDWEGAAREAVRLRYWKNIDESIHGWEEGKGGGILHH